MSPYNEIHSVSNNMSFGFYYEIEGARDHWREDPYNDFTNGKLLLLPPTRVWDENAKTNLTFTQNGNCGDWKNESDVRTFVNSILHL